jgi:hypothetical protein
MGLLIILLVSDWVVANNCFAVGISDSVSDALLSLDFAIVFD